MSFYFEKLPKESQVIIYIPYVRRCITTYLTEGFNFNTSANWSSSSGNETEINSLNTVIRDITAANNIWAGGSAQRLVQHNIVNLMQTISSYQSSGAISFTLKLNFLATRSTDNVLEDVNVLQSCTLPRKFENKPLNSGDDKSPLGRLIAPMNYDMTSDSCVSVNIGRWFRTPQLFLITKVDAMFSKQTIKGTGLPLFATDSVTFQCYRMVDEEDVKGWFALGGAFTEYKTDFGEKKEEGDGSTNLATAT